jgi:hypothetical protein
MSFWINDIFSCSGDSIGKESESLDLKSAFQVDRSTLVMQAIQVGTITRTCIVEVTFDIGKEYHDTMKLFTYEKNQVKLQSISGQKALHEDTRQPMLPTNEQLKLGSSLG